jgi:hypothetical protein
MLGLISCIIIFFFGHFVYNAYDEYNTNNKNLIIESLYREFLSEQEILDVFTNIVADLFYRNSEDRFNYSLFLNKKYSKYYDYIVSFNVNTRAVNIAAKDEDDNLTYSFGTDLKWGVIDLEKIMETLNENPSHALRGIIWSDDFNTFYRIAVNPLYDRNSSDYKPGRYIVVLRKLDTDFVTMLDLSNIAVEWHIHKHDPSSDYKETHMILDDVYGNPIIRIGITSYTSEILRRRTKALIATAVVFVFLMGSIMIKNMYILKKYDQSLSNLINELDCVVESKFSKTQINVDPDDNGELTTLANKINSVLDKFMSNFGQ